ncbi:endolytic transglycosylase MltG [Halopseudomonas phragmitis]|uniref:Endolytic murein transglycosylase n=2 Tax=Pseudomonadaceae TaxID=135621 RepID=A0A1V0B6S5_9GAMM|nr:MULTISPECIES: endolytic transglycosylase MltG [Pseudomonadaceae]AQZ95636.1 aminodeoxychorismate lyase [Halopseudomonas phragmitis]RHW22603.1 endolytic transglycosylase MltG [Pseudomonas jilinensis]
MKAVFRFLSLLVVFSVLVSGSVALWGYFTLQAVLSQPVRIEQPETLDVPPGTTPARLFGSLEQRGWIERGAWVRRYWQWRMPGSILQIGEYALEPDLQVRDLLGMLQRGEVLQRSVTLVEGWNFRQFRAALARAERLEQTLPAELTAQQVMAELGLGDVHPEGQFFPDTYLYTLNMSDRDILLRAYQRMQTVLAEAWEQRADNLPISTPYEALILASIIEKETGVPYERGEIAGVFARRLRIGMRLQTDPTVIYGMGEDYNGRIRRADLRRPTPYNTYVINGLPPTPIAMPGREALVAAVNPEPGTSLYFVARGDGSHVFSDTLQQHNRAVRKYQIEQRAANYRSSPPPALSQQETAP